MYRPNRTNSGDLFAEPLTPPESFRRKNADEQASPSEYSPGLLDLHSSDSEFLTEVAYLDLLFR